MNAMDRGAGVVEIGSFWGSNATKDAILALCRKQLGEIFFATTTQAQVAAAQALEAAGFEATGELPNAGHGPNILTLWVKHMKRRRDMAIPKEYTGYKFNYDTGDAYKKAPYTGSNFCCGLHVKPIATEKDLPQDRYLTVAVAPKTPPKHLVGALEEAGFRQLAKGRFVTLWGNGKVKAK